MTSYATWSLDAKLLDAYVLNLRKVTSTEYLRKYEVVLLRGGAVDAHASAYARAYRVKGPNGSIACLRFWLNTPPTSILKTYAALELAPDVRTRCGLSQVRLFNEAVAVDGTAIPAVFMDWVEGSAVADAVNQHLNNSSELLRIAEALRTTFASLNEHRTSHGDLRSSNILVSNDRRSIRVGLIDLDSIRWRGGLTTQRSIGGNEMWNRIRRRDAVSLLESDYLDQAMTYLTIVAVAAERSWWRGPTDGFLTFKQLRIDTDEALHALEQMNGTPARLACAVRRAIDAPGHWNDIADVMSHPTSAPLSEATFWGLAMEGRGSRGRPVRKAPHPAAPEPTKTEVPQPFSNVPSQPPTNRMPPWLWIIVVITIAVIVVFAYWLKQP
jgi:hypothetical protein